MPPVVVAPPEPTSRLASSGAAESVVLGMTEADSAVHFHGEFACHGKACAPPPVGKGGSLPRGSGDGGGKTLDSDVSQQILLSEWAADKGDPNMGTEAQVKYGFMRAVGADLAEHMPGEVLGSLMSQQPGEEWKHSQRQARSAFGVTGNNTAEQLALSGLSSMIEMGELDFATIDKLIAATDGGLKSMKALTDATGFSAKELVGMGLADSMQESWTHHFGRSGSSLSIGLQDHLSTKFGIKKAGWLQTSASALGVTTKEAIGAWADSHQRVTHKILDDAGIGKLKVYRGTNRDFPGDYGQEVFDDWIGQSDPAVNLNPVSSWTTDKTVTSFFINSTSNTRSSSVGMILTDTVDRSDVFSIGGIGSFNESEVLVKGGQRTPDIDVRHTPWRSRTASVIVAACHSRACAPPPVGKGGSLPEGGGAPQFDSHLEAEELDELAAYITKRGTTYLGGGVKVETVAHWDDMWGLQVNGGVFKNGEQIGFFKRRIGVEGDLLVATHDSFHLYSARGQGIGPQIFAQQIDMWKDIGLDMVRTDATSAAGLDTMNGAYVWGKAGFDWDGFPWGVQNALNEYVEYGESWDMPEGSIKPVEHMNILNLAEQFNAAADTDDAGALPTPAEVATAIPTFMKGTHVEWDGQLPLTSAGEDYIVNQRDEARLDFASNEAVVLVAACHSKACAPPPVGRGGSISEGGGGGAVTPDTERKEGQEADAQAAALFPQKFTVGGEEYEVEIHNTAWVGDMDAMGATMATTGAIVDSDGTQVGVFQRVFYAEQAVVNNISIKIHEDFQGQGIGSKFISESFQRQSEAGYNEVQTTAVSNSESNGVYTWAKAGFDWHTKHGRPGWEDVVETLEARSIAIADGDEPVLGKTSVQLSDYAAKFWGDLEPPTPVEFVNEFPGLAKGETWLSVAASMKLDISHLRNRSASIVAHASHGLTASLVAHAPGRHDQKTHGRRKGAAPAAAVAFREALETGNWDSKMVNKIAHEYGISAWEVEYMLGDEDPEVTIEDNEFRKAHSPVATLFREDLSDGDQHRGLVKLVDDAYPPKEGMIRSGSAEAKALEKEFPWTKDKLVIGADVNAEATRKALEGMSRYPDSVLSEVSTIYLGVMARQMRGSNTHGFATHTKLAITSEMLGADAGRQFTKPDRWAVATMGGDYMHAAEATGIHEMAHVAHYLHVKSRMPELGSLKASTDLQWEIETDPRVREIEGNPPSQYAEHSTPELVAESATMWALDMNDSNNRHNQNYTRDVAEAALGFDPDLLRR